MNKQIIKLCMLGTILLSSSQLFCELDDLLEKYKLSDQQKSAINLFCKGMPAGANRKEEVEHVMDAVLSLPPEKLTPMFLTVGCQLTQGMNGENIRFIINDISTKPKLLIKILDVFNNATMQELNASVKPDDIVGLIRDLPFIEPDQWKDEITRIINLAKLN